MSEKLSILVLVFICIGCAHGGVSFTGCGSNGVKILSIDIEGCDEKGCKLPRGKTHEFTANVNSTIDLTGGKLVASTYVLGFIPYELASFAICDRIQPACGEVDVPTMYSAILSVPVSGWAPTGLYKVTTTATDAQGVQIACAELNIDLV